MQNFSLHKIENQQTFCMPSHRDICALLLLSVWIQECHIVH